MPLESAKTRRRATSFSALNVGTQPRKKSATTAGPDGQDFQNNSASITRLDKGTFSLPSPGAIGAGAIIEVSVTVADAQIPVTIDGSSQQDLVIINSPISLEAGLNVGSERVTALNTITFRISNQTGGSITPATNTYQFFLVRS